MANSCSISDKVLQTENGDLHNILLRLMSVARLRSKKISNDQELIQSDPISCPQNQKGNN